MDGARGAVLQGQAFRQRKAVDVVDNDVGGRSDLIIWQPRQPERPAEALGRLQDGGARPR